jgi:hypothetical protein
MYMMSVPPVASPPAVVRVMEDDRPLFRAEIKRLLDENATLRRRVEDLEREVEAERSATKMMRRGIRRS